MHNVIKHLTMPTERSWTKNRSTEFPPVLGKSPDRGYHKICQENWKAKLYIFINKWDYVTKHKYSIKLQSLEVLLFKDMNKEILCTRSKVN